MIIPTKIVSSVEPSQASDYRVRQEFLALFDQGADFICAGDAKRDPTMLLQRGQTPKSKVSLFGTSIFLTNPRQNPDLRFLVAYVVPPSKISQIKVFPRIFYKDVSLIWRAGTHLFLDGNEMWIGKGDTKFLYGRDWQQEVSDESTTDLPFEIQDALESLNRTKPIQQATTVLQHVLQRAPRDRIRAYDEFVRPRRLADSVPGNRVHRGRRVVWFKRRGDPSSLCVAPGFEPDFASGVLGVSSRRSKLYGGDIRGYRVLSINRKIQHFFLIGPRHVWMIPPQSLTTELSSFGVRTVGVVIDEDAYVPGYEYHFLEDDEDGQPQLHSQIPAGYVGEPSPIDDTRSDASPWLEQLPLLIEFRRFVERTEN